MAEDDFEGQAERQRAAGDLAAALALSLRAWTGPDDEVAEKNLDLVHEWGDIDAALELITTAAEAGNTGAYEALADLLIRLERPEDAVAALEGAALGGRNVTPWTAAVLAEELEDRVRAEEYYKQVLAEGNPRALNDYGVFLSEDDERLDEAADLLGRAISQGDTMAAAATSADSWPTGRSTRKPSPGYGRLWTLENGRSWSRSARRGRAGRR
ncbi:tetratricopeptide repeat protein [Streptomyces sp. NPDC005784]|uniref:tetratricopeptide repeat protein n=1 Tax=Streptomyces sp. NPDC005784 TaxID=3364731 RepID=UPI0036B425DB